MIKMGYDFMRIVKVRNSESLQANGEWRMTKEPITQYAIRNTQSAIRNTQYAIRNPPYAIPSSHNGRYTVNVLPWPGADATSIQPPCSVTSSRAMGRPRPAPATAPSTCTR